MLSPKQKAKQIEVLNQQFIEVGVEENKTAYERYYNKVIKELTKPRDKELTSKQVRKVVKETPINENGYVKQVYNSIVLSGLTSVVENQKLDKDDMLSLAPIFAIASFYGNRPSLLARKTQTMVNAFISGNKSKLNSRDKKIYPEFDRYFNKNKKTINKMLVTAKKQIKVINREIKNTTSKRIVKILKQESNKRVSESVFKTGKFEEVKRFQTAKEVKAAVRNQFESEIEWRVNRILDTEIKSLEEQTKLTQHLLLGYTHKTWRTELDKRVRPTHRKLEGKTIKIDKKFRVGSGWGMYPADPNLPVQERINERCTLVLIKRS